MKSKNLFDIGKEINEMISYVEQNDEHIIGIEMNEHTLSNINDKGIHGFINSYGNMIPVILDNTLIDNEIRFLREKNDKPIEYAPYEVKE